MLENLSCAQLWDIMILVDFQNQCLRKSCGHILPNLTQLKDSMILQTDGVTGSELFSIPKFSTSEHARKPELRAIVRYHDFGRFSKSMSEEVLWPYSAKLDSIKVLYDATNR